MNSTWLRREAQKEAVLLIVVACLGLIGGILAVGQAYCLTQLIAGVFLRGMESSAIYQWLAALLVLACLRAGNSWLEETKAASLAAVIMLSVRGRLLAHLLALGPGALTADPPGKLLTVLSEGVESLENYFSGYWPQMLRAVLVPILLLALIGSLDIVSAVMMLVTAPLIPLFMILIGRQAEKKNKKQWLLLLRLGGHFFDVLSGLLTLKLFGRSREQAAVIARLSGEFRDATLSVLKIAFLSALALELLTTLSTALIAVAVSLRLLAGTLTFEQAFFVLLLAPEYYLPLRLLGSQFHAGLAGKAAVADITRLLAISEPRMADGREFTCDAPVSISFVDVDFSYQASCASEVKNTVEAAETIVKKLPAALKHISFNIAAGQQVALVGASGAGKSTVAALLAGFWQPAAGVILVNGLDLTKVKLADWRRYLAVVPQRPWIFNCSVADNIAMACQGGSRPAIVSAAKAALAHDFIMALPAGYDTMLGAKGQGLSGGEKQRLAIARAFLRNAPVIILDEATRGLDPKTEEQVQAAIKRLLNGRTALIIAHKLNTVRQADQIIVMAEGKVQEQGKHEELLASSGLYHHLLQAYCEEVP